MILLCKLRRCHFPLLIIHRIACQLQSGAKDGNDFIQYGIRTDAAITGVEIEIQIFNANRAAFYSLRFRIAAAAGRSGIRLLPRIPHISNGPRRAFVLTAMAMVDTPIGIHNNRNGRFLLIINTMRAETDAGAALHTGQNVNHRIPVFRHFCFPLYTSKYCTALKK